MQTGMKALRARMEYLLACPKGERQTSNASSDQESTCEPLVPWALEEWRLTAIPEWRAMLWHSIEDRGHQGEMNARWMLGEVLEDPDYLNAGD